jgi:TRAP transporter TAXI family solute receptor
MWNVLFFVFSITLSTASCLGGAAAQHIYGFVSNPQGSQNYSVSVALAQVMDRKLGMQVRVIPTAGSSTFVPILDRNEAELGMLNVEETRTAYSGTGTFTRSNPHLKILSVMWPLTISIMVPVDSPIRSIAELKGKRMPVGFRAQQIGIVIQDALLANAGLSPADITGLPTASLFSGVDLMASGKADASTISVGIGQVQQAAVKMSSRGGVRFLSIDTSPSAMARLTKHFIAYPLKLEPSPSLAGITEPTTVMAYDMFWLTNDKMPDDVAYKLTKMLHESHADLRKITPIMDRFNPARMTTDIGVPYHPGALRYYREIGQWPPKT